jgi:hypothetical protein
MEERKIRWASSVMVMPGDLGQEGGAVGYGGQPKRQLG